MQKHRRILKKSEPGTSNRDIFLKSPSAGNKRATFAIIERKAGKNTTLKSEALDSINKQFKDKKLNFQQAQILCKDIIDQLKPKTAILHNQSNLNLLKLYWDAEYTNRDIVDRNSAWNRLVRAIEAIGHHSLLSASKEELQSEVDSHSKGNRQRSVVAALNQLLKHFKRDIKLRRVREEIDQIRYITEAELDKLLVAIKLDHLRLMHKVAYGTGLRAGELFGVLPEHIKEKHVDVTSQIDVNKTRRQTKNRKVRKALILKGFRPYLLKWAQIPLEERLQFRKRSISKITRQASRKALGREICFHDLRHSYAIYLVSKNVSVSLVAQFIGDSIRVAERYYSGFTATTESIEYVASLLS